MTWERLLSRAIAAWLFVAVLTGVGAIVVAFVAPGWVGTAVHVWLLCMFMPPLLIILGICAALAMALWRGEL